MTHEEIGEIKVWSDSSSSDGSLCVDFDFDGIRILIARCASVEPDVITLTGKTRVIVRFPDRTISCLKIFLDWRQTAPEDLARINVRPRSDQLIDLTVCRLRVVADTLRRVWSESSNACSELELLLLGQVSGREVCYPADPRSTAPRGWHYVKPEEQRGAFRTLEGLTEDSAIASRARLILELDKSALCLCREFGAPGLAMYNYLVSGSGEKSLRRTQALRSMPFLAPLLIGEASLARHVCRMAVDEGWPLVHAAMFSLDIKKTTVRSLSRIPPRSILCQGDAYQAAPTDSIQFLRTINDLPLKMLPRSEEEWGSAIALYHGFSSLSFFSSNDQESWGALFRHAARIGWVPAIERVVRTCSSIEVLKHVAGLCNAIRVWVWDELESEERLPLDGTTAWEEIACLLDSALLAIGPWQLLEWTARWRLAREALLIGLERPKVEPEIDDEVLAFPITDPMSLLGLTVVPLLSRQAMADEGSRMEHCAGNLYHHCRNQVKRMFSVRNSKGDSQSTFQIGIYETKSAGVRVAVDEHRGRANSRPPDKCREVVEEYVKFISENVDDSNLRALIASALEARRREGQTDPRESLAVLRAVPAPTLRKLMRQARRLSDSWSEL